ncbi:MAG: myo-inositol 2-dehydrogenase/D-chiro-inositol 1-dehydrogenase [Limisphaerales bacterium]
MEKSRAFRQGRSFGYLEEQDRYLIRGEPPLFHFGFIGCGIMGQEHITNTLLEGRAGVGGVYDVAPKSVAHTMTLLKQTGVRPLPKVYESLAEAIDDPVTQALIISTPNHTHLDLIRELVGCDKVLFLEKPIATTVADAAEIYRLLNGHNAAVHIGLQYRYKSVYREAIHEVLDKRSVGEVHSVQLLEHRFPFLDKVGQWNKFNANTGGTLVEKCCHYFDLINLFSGGKPEQVFALGSQGINFREFEHEGKVADGLDQANVLIRYSNGVMGNFSLNMFTNGSREELIVCGDAARLHTVESARLGEPSSNSVALWAGDSGVSRESSPTYPSYIARAGHHGSTFHEHVALVDGMLGKKLEKNSQSVAPPTLLDGVWAVLVASAAQLSIERQVPVELEELVPEGLPEYAPFINGKNT